MFFELNPVKIYALMKMMIFVCKKLKSTDILWTNYEK